MKIGDPAADNARCFGFGHQEGQIVVRVVIEALFPHKSGAIIGQAPERLVHRLLKQVAADVLRQANLDDVAAFPVFPVKLGCAAGVPFPGREAGRGVCLCHASFPPWSSANTSERSF